MLNTWAAQRKLVYTILFAGITAIVIGIPAFFIFYTPPSCTDGKQNQGETGVDCGGSCQNLCQAAELPPVVIWSQRFQVTPGVYTAVAYVENPNVRAEARNVPYTFTLLDDKGLPIVERKGMAFIPAHKKFAIFESGIRTEGRTPTRAEFSFTNKPYWVKEKIAQPILKVSDQVLTDETGKPRIDALITNTSINTVTNVDVVAIVYESNGNAIATSKTFVESLEKDQTAPLVFTWPNPFPSRVASCEVPTDVVLAIDRSGSMDDDSLDPPQPLTDVKNAAASFIDKLKSADQAAVVSFANTGSEPIDLNLTNDYAKLKKAIASIAIAVPTQSQNTNIADGILKASQELESTRHQSAATKVIVLLTDGVPTRPEKKGDEKYPEQFALSTAADARDRGDEIYTIGLGSSVNASFLEQLATAPEYFYPAASTKSLNTIYKNIATSLCRKGPTKIELIPIVRSR